MKDIYFLSSENRDNTELIPRIPSNFLIDNGFEDSKNKRVLFNETIDGAVMSKGKDLKNNEYYVNIAVGNVRTYKPHNKQVPACNLTREIWVKHKVKLKCIGKIKVEKQLRVFKYKYGGNKEGELYSWKWKWLEKYNNKVVTESEDKSIITKNYKSKGKKDLSKMKKINIHSSEMKKYIDKFKELKDYKKDAKYFKGYIFLDGDKLVGYVTVCENHIIAPIHICPDYRGYGLSNQMMDVAIKELGADELYCHTDNKIAIKLYKSKGFNITDSPTTKGFYNMKLVKESVNLDVNDQLKDIDTPEKLLDWMSKNIKYKHYDTYSSTRLLETHDGDCWDQSGFEYKMIKKMGLKCGKLFMVEYYDWEKPGGDTHTVCWFIRDNKLYWFENSWENERGIHKIPKKSLESLKEVILSKWNWSGKNDKMFFGKVGKVKDNMKFIDYQFACTPEESPKDYYTRESVDDKYFHRVPYDNSVVKESTMEYLTESFIINKDNLEINIDKWKPGEPLWITGSSGDGKTTLSKKYKNMYKDVELAHTDALLVRLCKPKEKFIGFCKNELTDEDNLDKDYLLSHPDLPFNISKVSDVKSTVLKDYFIEYFMWMYKQSKTNPKYKNKRIIIEGCDIQFLDPEFIKDKPLIIIGGSRLISFIHRIKRKKAKDGDIKYSTLIPLFIKKYFTMNRHLDSKKDRFRKNVEKALKESVSPDTKQQCLDDFTSFINKNNYTDIIKPLKNHMTHNSKKIGDMLLLGTKYSSPKNNKTIENILKKISDNVTYNGGKAEFKCCYLPGDIFIYIKIPKNKLMKESVNDTYIKEKTLSSKERNSLDTSDFGIPELRKYPLIDKNHVLSAIRYFNKVDSDHEKELAKNIFKAMKKYNIKISIIGEKNRLKGYLHLYKK